MFQLTRAEFLRCQFGTSKRGGRRYLPYAFTEQGVAMFSSVLNSERAIMANIQIIQIEKKYDGQFNIVFEAIKKLLTPPPVKPKPQIGFRPDR